MKLVGRKSGILLHITSLPSPYGIGDFGPEAYRFADFLVDAGQHYWQVLPFNPTSVGTGNSPYSSISAMAGNTLMISPDILIEEGYLEQSDLRDYKNLNLSSVNYEEVTFMKNRLFDIAFQNFKDKATSEEQADFEHFCKRNIHWLEDFILYNALKAHYGGKDWSQWPEELRDRMPMAMEKAKLELKEFVEKERFLQWKFFRQWQALKAYSEKKSLYFIGDIPFYINYDSADVWTNPEFFKLNEKKKPIVVCGVPPDYFNKNGQLWGMPIYDWDKLAEEGHSWWIERMKQNFRMFSLVRLDHFRAFSEYWEVPATHKTAKKGKYITGPGVSFFNALKEKFEQLPVIAEDLGDIDEPVRELMYAFDLPGMRLLQFAFADHAWGEKDYLPHNHIPNCVVYPGTHDNDTIRTWYKKLSSKGKQNVDNYVQGDVTLNNVHDCMVSMAFMSVANLCIVSMQDVLGLGEEGTMNKPSTATGNWEWRLTPGQVDKKLAKKLRTLSDIYERNSL